MIELTQAIDFINLYFKPLFLVISSIFGIYFTIQKIGDKVEIIFETSKGQFSKTRISNIVLTNKKNKLINIWSINAVFNKELKLNLDEFNPPLILKPHESLSLTLPDYSNLNINGEDYKFSMLQKNIEVYIDSGDKCITCIKKSKNNNNSVYTQISKEIYKFNAHTYNEYVSYILVYFYQNESKTAFISHNGYIGNEWEFSPNHFGNVEVTPDNILNMLKSSGLHSVFTNYICHKVNYPMTELVFSKKNT